MHPILIQFGTIFVSSWHFFYLMGSLATWLFLHRNRRSILPEMSPDQIDQAFILGYVAGYFGARLLSIGLEEEFRQPNFSWMQSLLNLGSMTLYGGVLGAVLVLLVYAFRSRISILGFSDLFVPATLIAVGFGRIGC